MWVVFGDFESQASKVFILYPQKYPAAVYACQNPRKSEALDTIISINFLIFTRE